MLVKQRKIKLKWVNTNTLEVGDIVLIEKQGPMRGCEMRIITDLNGEDWDMMNRISTPAIMAKHIHPETAPDDGEWPIGKNGKTFINKVVW